MARGKGGGVGGGGKGREQEMDRGFALGDGHMTQLADNVLLSWTHETRMEL